jgi:hypothetical protein
VGIVPKRRDMAYRSGRVKSWLKIKNPKSPAMLRIEEGDVLKWNKREIQPAPLQSMDREE